MNLVENKRTPIMGTSALLKKTNVIVMDDSMLVHDIVLGKYNETLTRQIDKINKRKQYKLSISIDNDNVEDSENYSAITSCSINSKEFSFNSQFSNKEEEFLKNIFDFVDMESQHCKQEVKKKRSSNIRTSFISFMNNNNIHNDNVNYLESLKKDLALQNEILYQISKALIYCRKSKQFVFSKQHLEAEKILLVTSLTKEVLTCEINSIEFDNYVKPNVDVTNSADVEIENIKFCAENIDSIYVLVMTCGKQVSASNVVGVNRKNNELNFTEKFKFEKLTCDFCIQLYLYECLANKDEQEGDVKCTSIKSLFKFPRKSKISNETFRVKPSMFALKGFCVLTRNSLPENDQISTSLTLKDSSDVSHKFSLKISRFIRWKSNVEGFLTIGIENDKNCTIWNRRWCKLHDSLLKYWNYPSEENMQATGCIYLNLALDQTVKIAERTICARPRTLLITINHDGNVKKNYLLCADTNFDMEMWQREINNVLTALSVWKLKTTNN